MKSEQRTAVVDWMGETPSDWQRLKLSSLYQPRNEKVSSEEYPALSVTMRGIVPQLETAAKSQDVENRKLVKVGDFVINSRSDRRGSCGVARQDGSVSLISNVLTPLDSDSMCAEYFEYLFKTEGFADEFYKWGTGIVDDLWSTNWTRMKNIVVAVPKLSDQRAIANHLDAKTAEIDSLIEKTERSIELLEEYRKSVISEAVTKGLDPNVPMKDSGIEWIGEIPAHWAMVPISLLTSKIGSGKTPKGGSQVYEKEGILFLRSQNIYDSGLELAEPAYVSAIIDEEMANTRVYSGDVLLNITGGSIGRCCVYDLEQHANINQHVCILRPLAAIKSKYLQFFWNSSLGATSIHVCQMGQNRESINFEQIGATRVPLPPIDEQIAIISKLSKNINRIEISIACKKALVSLLSEYRKSLISEAVTGKFKVPGVE